MRILKIMDGFITNSSTQSSTILLAVRRGKKIKNLLEKLNFKKKVPEDFLEFTDDANEMFEFNELHHTNLSYLEKEYNLFINTIPYYGFEPELLEDDGYRFNLIGDLVKKIKEQYAEDVLILFYGDILHSTFYHKPLDIYTKAEVSAVFKANNVEVIKSLIITDIVKKLDFKSNELQMLANSFTLPITELINEPQDNYDIFRFDSRYYSIFSDNYLKALVEIGLNSEFVPRISPYFPQDPWSLDKVVLEIFQAKLDGKLLEINDDLRKYFNRVITTIKRYFGSNELIKFLNTYPKFEFFTKVGSYESSRLKYCVSLSIIARAVVETIRNEDKSLTIIATKIHEKLIDELQELTTPIEFGKGHIYYLPTIILPYFEYDQYSLIIPFIASLSQREQTMLLGSNIFYKYKSRIEKELDNYNNNSKEEPLS